MRKITSLLMLFCMFVGTAWAQLVETSTETAPKYYLLGSYDRGGYLTSVGVGAGLKHIDIADASYWYFEKANEDGGVYIVNKVKDGENKIYVDHNRQASTSPAVWYILENGVNKLGVSISTTNPISGSSCIDANNSNDGVGSWNPNSNDWKGTTWGLVDVNNQKNATYNPNNLMLRSRTDRTLTSISLVGSMENATVTLNHDYTGAGLVWLDKTATTIKVVAGEELTASVTTEANWMNTFAYIDTDGTPGFSASIAEDGFTPAGDLVSYSFYSGDETNGAAGKNSAGTELTEGARNTKVLPAFKAPSTPGTYRMRIKLDWNSINPNGGNSNFMTDGGSFVDVTLEVVDPNATIDVVYNFVYGGKTKYTQTSAAQVGEEYPEISVADQFVYGVSAVKPTGVIEEGDVVEGTVTKTIELIDNLPFVAAADYASIKNWYYIQAHSNQKKYIQAVEDYIEWADATVNASEIDSYTWGFIGNPFDGFKLVNYGKGSTMGVNLNGSGNPAMGDINSATAWTIKASRTNPTAEYFCFQYPVGEYMNAQSGKIAFWWDNDNGSTMCVTERDMSGATELQAVIDQVEAFFTADVTGGTTVGYLTSESVANVAAKLAAAKEAVKSKEGCIAAQAYLQEAVAAVETIQPEEGKFYVIASAMPESDGRSGQKMYVNNTRGMQFNNGNTIANVFQFVSDGDGKFFLKSVERGTYMNSAKGHNGGQETADAKETTNAKAIAIANMGRANVVSLIPNGGAMMHAQAAGSSVVAWNNTDNAGASAWVISEVNIEDYAHSVTVTEAGWATLVLGYNATIPADVTVYAVSALSTETATLTEVQNVIPANEAVLVNAPAETYKFKYTGGALGLEGENLLEGTVFDTNINENAYVLGIVNEEVGLYKAAMNVDENTAFLNNAFKAYLPKTNLNGANALRFNFGETTGIEGVIEGTNANAVIFDLSGRRVAKMQKGIYIMNGKKVYVK